MTTSVTVINESNMASGLVGSSGEEKTISLAKDVEKVDAGTSDPTRESPTSPPNADVKAIDSSKKTSSNGKKEQEVCHPPTPTQYRTVQVPGYPPSLTAQCASAYHYSNYNSIHMTSEPPSPAGHQSVTDVYNVGSYFQPQSFGSSISHLTAPISPQRPGMSVCMVGGIPASPLFPRATALAENQDVGLNQHRGAPPSPSIPFIITQGHPGAPTGNMYQTYPVTSVGSRGSEDGNWTGTALERSVPNSFPSPQNNHNVISYQGVMPSRAGDRAYSFDDTLVPPSASSLQEPPNAAYSPYSTSQTSPGGSTYTHPSWGYGTHPDMYGSAVSPLQQRSVTQMSYFTGMQAGTMRQMAPYNPFYPATSPGPPIHTTGSNKGPDGANLFIFHIPNHFTNLDMYQLFHPYGNLLSVRIMVEKDTGRSRGFGFVSYDAPESAVLAIKGLNGFPIGNKRLKVQQKQTKSRDMQDRDSPDDSFLDASDIGFAVGTAGLSVDTTLWREPSALGPYAEDGVDEQNQLQEPSNYAVPAGVLDAANLNDSNTLDSSTDQTPLSTLNQLQTALPDISALTTAP